MLTLFIAYTCSENAVRFVSACTQVPGIRVLLITQDVQEAWPEDVRRAITGHYRVDDVFNLQQLQTAARGLEAKYGRFDRALAAMEQLQLPLAELRASLGLPGMSVAITRNFRDKALMKHLFHQHGVPSARFQGFADAADARTFAAANGYPVIVKPLDGAASQATFKCDDAAALDVALAQINPSAQHPGIIEEFIIGEEGSLDTISIDGVPVWHSLTHYLPTPLECMQQPWIQWRIVLPREADDARYDDVRAAGSHALRALGMGSGLTHLEWFRRADGTLAISEVAARPPGANITTLISRSCDVDFPRQWCELMLHNTFTPPTRAYAVGAAFLRGHGGHRVASVRGWDVLQAQLGTLICDYRLPQVGQPKSSSYEGEGFVIVRATETQAVRDALQLIVETARVDLA